MPKTIPQIVNCPPKTIIKSINCESVKLPNINAVMRIAIPIAGPIQYLEFEKKNRQNERLLASTLSFISHSSRKLYQ